MLTKIETDWQAGILREDPVRPHLPITFRLSSDRIALILTEDNEETVKAVICIAFTNKVPTNEQELDTYSQQACQDGQQGTTAISIQCGVMIREQADRLLVRWFLG